MLNFVKQRFICRAFQTGRRIHCGNAGAIRAEQRRETARPSEAWVERIAGKIGIVDAMKVGCRRQLDSIDGGEGRGRPGDHPTIGSLSRCAALTTASSSSSRSAGVAPLNQLLLEVNQNAICQGLIGFGNSRRILATVGCGWPSRNWNAG